MQWLKTFSLVVRSNVAALAEQFENPELTLNQLVIDMEEEVGRVRATVAGVMADEIQLSRQVEKARDDVKNWQERTEKAIQRRDDDQARQALEQKVFAAERAAGLEREFAKHKEETARLHRALRDLEAKIREVRHRRSLLAARMARADSARTINSVLRRADETSSLAQFRRLEARVERAEALEEAFDRLDDQGPSVRDLEHAFEERERQERLQAELDDLKHRLEGHE